MKPEAQRILIARACGWENVEVESIGAPPYSWRLCGTKKGSFTRLVPDYPNDLNAIHEAEKVLTDVQWLEYTDKLFYMGPRMAHSTAAQRAEAFLRTIGKWEESK